MNEAQFKVVKTMLAFPGITPRKLVKAWKSCGVILGTDLAQRAAVANNYQEFLEIPDEDVVLRFKNMFGI